MCAHCGNKGTLSKAHIGYHLSAPFRQDSCSPQRIPEDKARPWRFRGTFVYKTSRILGTLGRELNKQRLKMVRQ